MSHISTNFDRTGFQMDVQLVFPLDRLRELAARQIISSRHLADWLRGRTSAAKVINEIRLICLADTSGKLGLLGKLLLVPRSQMHRFETRDE